MSGQTMEGLNLADQLMDPTSHRPICANEPQNNFAQTIEDFELPPQDLQNQPYTDNQNPQEIADIYTGDLFGFSMKECLELTPSLEALLLSDQNNSVDLDNIDPSIHQLARQPAVQLPGLDTECQHQHAPIVLPDSSTLALTMALYGQSAKHQGTLESPTPIAVINPLTNEMAWSDPHPIQNRVLTVPAQSIEPVNNHSSQAAVPTAINPISPTLATSSDHPAIRSDSKQKSKAKKKRRRGERKTPTSSPSSSLVLDKKKRKIMENPSPKEEYAGLPSGNELRIQLSYQKYCVRDEKINSQDGFLAYHKKAWKFPDTGSALDLTNIDFPQLKENPTKFKMTESQKNSTEKLLDAMTKGVHVSHDDSHNIYVTRYCKSHVFCYTTDLGKDDITENVLQRPDLLYQIKLDQGERVKVFDNVSLIQKVASKMIHKMPIRSPPPFIVLSFGQIWQEGFPLSNNLVYMKITPRRQRMQYSVEEIPSLDCDRTHLLTSMSSLSLNSSEDKCAH